MKLLPKTNGNRWQWAKSALTLIVQQLVKLLPTEKENRWQWRKTVMALLIQLVGITLLGWFALKSLPSEVKSAGWFPAFLAGFAAAAAALFVANWGKQLIERAKLAKLVKLLMLHVQAIDKIDEDEREKYAQCIVSREDVLPLARYVGATTTYKLLSCAVLLDKHATSASAAGGGNDNHKRGGNDIKDCMRTLKEARKTLVVFDWL